MLDIVEWAEPELVQVQNMKCSEPTSLLKLKKIFYCPLF